MIRSPESPFSPRKSLIRPVFFNCLTLVVILTLCLYGLGVVGLYLHWFVLGAVPTEIPTPIIVTVIMTAEPGTDQEPIVITVVATRPPDNSRPPTATLEPTPTQWWPQATPADEPTLISPANTRESTPANATTNNAPYAGGDSAPIVLPEALPSHTPAEGLLSPPF